MALRHPVHEIAEAQRQTRHVEPVAAGERAQPCEIDEPARCGSRRAGSRLRLAPEQPCDEIVGEVVMARVNGRMSREATMSAHPWQVVSRLTRAYVLGRVSVPPQELDAEERGMTLIHVVLAHPESEGVQDPHA